MLYFKEKPWLIFCPCVFADLFLQSTSVHVPSWVSVQLIEDCLLTELKHQMEASFPPEDLQQIHQIHMFQLLQAQHRSTNIKHSNVQFALLNLPLRLHMVNLTL